MEDLCNRVLWISKSICKELDHVSLVNFKDTSRDITKNLESERFYWISNRSALVLFNLFSSIPHLHFHKAKHSIATTKKKVWCTCTFRILGKL